MSLLLKPFSTSTMYIDTTRYMYSLSGTTVLAYIVHFQLVFGPLRVYFNDNVTLAGINNG